MHKMWEMKNIFFLLLTIGVFFSCKDPVMQKKISKQERVRMFQEKYRVKPDFSFQGKQNKLLFLKKDDGTLYNTTRVIVLEKKGTTWAETRNKEITEGYSTDSLSLVSLDKKEFIYFEEDQGGGSMGDHAIEFVLYDCESDKKYSIEYYEYPEGGTQVTRYTKSQNMANHKKISDYLENRIRKSAGIYSPDARERLIREFKKVNKSQLLQLEKSEFKNKPIQLKRITTKEVIFKIPLVDNQGNDEASIAGSAENRDFVVVSWFKGPVLAYNKSSGEYFCVYIPPLMDEYISYLKFDKTGNLLLIFEEGGNPFFSVNLSRSVITPK
jgi:hypothetical protein